MQPVYTSRIKQNESLEMLALENSAGCPFLIKLTLPKMYNKMTLPKMYNNCRKDSCHVLSSLLKGHADLLCIAPTVNR